MDDVEIRRAVRGDAGALAGMRAASAFERSGGSREDQAAYRDLCERFFAAELGREDSFLRSWIAVRAGVAAGSASLTVFPTLPRYGMAFGGLDGRIRDVYVHPDFRRAGLGRRLVSAALAEARALNLDRLMLGASDMGRPLYEGLGFVAKSDEMVYAPEPGS